MIKGGLIFGNSPSKIPRSLPHTPTALVSIRTWQEDGLGFSIFVSSLDGFPLLVELADDHLGVFVQSDGDDMVFTDHDGNVLPHEIESFNPDTGHLCAWVNVSTLWVDTPTSLYVYYGNSTCSSKQNPMGVWD